MVEVFKTNVSSKREAHIISEDLAAFFPGWKIKFDLEDCDNILRIDSGGEPVIAEHVKNIVTRFGYTAEPLND
ncbi:MAG: hypothetical protein JWO09_1797 [Bacteroidetes bacterium]|nr:hypothetical protein [Bacteroidota bacterium]